MGREGKNVTRQINHDQSFRFEKTQTPYALAEVVQSRQQMGLGGHSGSVCVQERCTSVFFSHPDVNFLLPFFFSNGNFLLSVQNISEKVAEIFGSKF